MPKLTKEEKKAAAQKKAAQKKAAQKKAAQKKAAAEKAAAQKEAAAEEAAAEEAAAEEAAADAGNSGQSGGRKTYRAVPTTATIPGVGEIKTTVYEVDFGEETYRNTTRKACGVWLKGKRAEKRERAKSLKEKNRSERENARIEKMIPRLTENLRHLAKKLSGLAAATVVTEAHRAQLNNAIGIINKVASERSEPQTEE